MIFIKRTVDTDHLVGFYRSAVEDCLGNNNVDFSGFILEYKLIAATVNKITA